MTYQIAPIFNVRSFIVFLIVALGISNISLAQNVDLKDHSNKKSLFASGNTLTGYTGDLVDLNLILNTNDPSLFNQAKTDLKDMYQAMSGIAIDDNILDSMLDPTQANYDVWMQTWTEVNMQFSPDQNLLLQGVISNIKTNL